MRNEERDVYVIPPNFIEGGTLLGGMFKTRNVIEAGVLGLLVGLPVLNLSFSLTIKVIILCLTALPLVLAALIGIAGSSLSAFILQFFRFLRNRRILTREPQKDNGEPKKSILPNWPRKRRPGQENKEREPMPASRSSLRFDRKERKVTQHKTFLPTEETVRPLNPLKESTDTKRLANILNRLVNGSARTFNQQTNVSLDNKYTVLDISELTGDLLTVGMFVALDFVWDKAKENRTEEKAIFIDECLQLIGANSNRLDAEFVLEIFKIIRGYGGSAICATQDINDFFALEDGKYGKGIINNAKTKILLNLEEEEARRVQSILHLSEAEVMEITHFERGNGLISTNNNNVTVEIKCSQLEKELITTDRRELRELLGREN